MIVIGDTRSANTKRLFELCQNVDRSPSVDMIQSAGDLNPLSLRGAKKVGITAGASTPKDVIDKVVDTISGNIIQP